MYFISPPIIPPMVYTHSFIYHQQYIILQTESIINTTSHISFMDRNLHLSGYFVHKLIQLKSLCHGVNSYHFKH